MKAKVSSRYFDIELDKYVDKDEVIEADNAKIERLKAVGIKCESVAEQPKAKAKKADSE